MRTIRISKSLVLFLVTVLALDFMLFYPSYFNVKSLILLDKPEVLYLFLFLYFFTSFVYWIYKPLHVITKSFAIYFTFIFSTVTGIVSVFLPMILPGSKEHNYIMYNVCMPAIEKYYKEKTGAMYSNEPHDKNGFGKWWHQHSECEENVRAGKGPVFSENPPEFVPLTK